MGKTQPIGNVNVNEVGINTRHCYQQSGLVIIAIRLQATLD